MSHENFNMDHLIVISCDGTPTNTGYKNGVIARMDRQTDTISMVRVSFPLQRVTITCAVEIIAWQAERTWNLARKYLRRH